MICSQPVLFKAQYDLEDTRWGGTPCFRVRLGGCHLANMGSLSASVLGVQALLRRADWLACVQQVRAGHTQCHVHLALPHGADLWPEPPVDHSTWAQFTWDQDR